MSVPDFMKIYDKAFCSLLLLGFALFLSWGCATDDKRASQAVVLETLESQLYSNESAVAERAALALLSSGSESAFRTLRSTLAAGTSSSARSAVLFAFTVQQDPRVRLEAADALGDISPRTVDLAKRYLIEVIGERAAGELLSRARDDSRPAAERIAAIEVVAEYGRKESVDGVIDLLEDRSSEIAAAAASALREITYQPFGGDPELWRSWHRQNRGLSRDEWREVGEFYYRETRQLEERIHRLSEEGSGLAGEIVELSTRIIDLAVSQNEPQYILALLKSSMPLEAQIYAVRGLGAMKAAGAVDLLLDKALSDQPRLAEAAILALGEIQDEDPQGLVVVASRLKDSDPGVRYAAAKAYGLLPGCEAKLLMPLLEDQSPAVRAVVAEAMGRHQHHPAFDGLVAALGDSTPEVRSAAARALGLLRDRAAVSALLELVDDDVDTVVYETVFSLSQIPDVRSYDALIRSAEHEDSGVRELAIVALERILALNAGDPRRATDKLFDMAKSDPVARVADRAWKALVPLLGNDPEIIFDRVDRLLDAELFDRAETLLKILADRSDNGEEVTEARRRLARTYLQQGNYQGALAYFRRILEQNPDDPEASAGVRNAMKGLDDWRGLASLYSGELTAGSHGQDVPERFLEALGRLTETGDYRHAVTLSETVLESAGHLGDEFREGVQEIQAMAFDLFVDKLIGSLAGEAAEREAAFADLAAVEGRAAEALVAALSSSDEAVRSAALELLGPLAEDSTFGFNPAHDPDSQQDSLAAWREWLSNGRSQ